MVRFGSHIWPAVGLLTAFSVTLYVNREAIGVHAASVSAEPSLAAFVRAVLGNGPVVMLVLFSVLLMTLSDLPRQMREEILLRRGTRLATWWGASAGIWVRTTTVLVVPLALSILAQGWRWSSTVDTRLRVWGPTIAALLGGAALVWACVSALGALGLSSAAPRALPAVGAIVVLAIFFASASLSIWLGMPGLQRVFFISVDDEPWLLMGWCVLAALTVSALCGTVLSWSDRSASPRVLPGADEVGGASE